MNPQFDHNLTSSFYLWFDNRLTNYTNAVITGQNQTFSYGDGIETPSNMNAFYGTSRQFCADYSGASTGIMLDGQIIYQKTTGEKVLFDHSKGRILMDKSYGTGNISGSFVQKEINLYTTNETDEEIIARNEFYIESGSFYSDSVNEIAKAKYCFPCVCLSSDDSDNKGFALGGLRDTKNTIKAVVFATSLYQLEGILGSFRDTSDRNFAVIDQKDFPYGQYWHVKQPPYSYTSLIASKKIGTSFIKKARAYKLKDSGQSSLQKIRKDIYLGYIDFEISSIRMT